MSEIDLAYQMALRNEEISQQKDPGTSLKHPTLRKGIVTNESPFQIDDLPAANVAGFTLPVGTVVWMLVDAGRRLAFAPASLGIVRVHAALRWLASNGSILDLRMNGNDFEVNPGGSGFSSQRIVLGRSSVDVVVPGNLDVSGDHAIVADAVQGGSTSLGTGFATLASFNLTIPTLWNTWRFEMRTTMAVVPSSATSNRNYEYRLRRSGSVQAPGTRQSIVFAGNPTTVTVDGGGTGTVSGSGTFGFDVQGRLTINDSYTVNQCYLGVTAYRVT